MNWTKRVLGSLLAVSAQSSLGFTTRNNCKRRFSSMAMSINNNAHRRFGPFQIPDETIFYRSNHSFAFCNLRPIVSGHVLVCSNTIVATLEELTEPEYLDLWKTVRFIQSILKQHDPQCRAFNVAVQDGKEAGQSVAHVHIHILPRHKGDFERNDDVYQHLEEWAPRPREAAVPQLNVPSDDQRRDRTVPEMASEAEQYRKLIESSSRL